MAFATRTGFSLLRNASPALSQATTRQIATSAWAGSRQTTVVIPEDDFDFTMKSEKVDPLAQAYANQLKAMRNVMEDMRDVAFPISGNDAEIKTFLAAKKAAYKKHGLPTGEEHLAKHLAEGKALIEEAIEDEDSTLRHVLLVRLAVFMRVGIDTTQTKQVLHVLKKWEEVNDLDDIGVSGPELDEFSKHLGMKTSDISQWANFVPPGPLENHLADSQAQATKVNMANLVKSNQEIIDKMIASNPAFKNIKMDAAAVDPREFFVKRGMTWREWMAGQGFDDWMEKPGNEAWKKKFEAAVAKA